MRNQALLEACFSMLFGLTLMLFGGFLLILSPLIGGEGFVAAAGIFLVIAGGINNFVAWRGYFKSRHIDNPDHSREDS